MRNDTDTVSARVERLLDQLRASKAAARTERLTRLADQNTPPEQRKVDEARERYDVQLREAQERHDAQEREAHRREVAKRFDELEKEAQRREAQQPKPTPTRTRKRRPTLTGVARQVTKAGVDVARYDVRPDGTISVVTGKPVGDIDTNDTTASPDPKWN